MSNWNISMLIKVAVTFMIILSIVQAPILSRTLLASLLAANKDKIPTVSISEAIDMMSVATVGTTHVAWLNKAFNVEVNKILYQVPDNGFIGYGLFGIVVKAKVLENNQKQKQPELAEGNEVALKLQLDNAHPFFAEKVRTEVKANQILANNPNVAQMYDKSKEGSENYHIIAMELMPDEMRLGGMIDDEHAKYKFTLDDIVNMGIQFSGIGKQLSAKNWVYLDWDTSNVFKEGEIFKLVSMGTCQKMDNFNGIFGHPLSVSDWLMYRAFDIMEEGFDDGLEDVMEPEEGVEDKLVKKMKTDWKRGINPIQNVAVFDAGSLTWMMVQIFGRTCLSQSELCREAKFYARMMERDMRGCEGAFCQWRVIQENRERLRSILDYELRKGAGLDNDEVYFFYKLSEFMPSVKEVETSKLNKMGKSDNVWKIFVDNLEDIKEHSKANGKSKPGAICDANDVGMEDGEEAEVDDEDEEDEEDVEDEEKDEPKAVPSIPNPNKLPIGADQKQSKQGPNANVKPDGSKMMPKVDESKPIKADKEVDGKENEKPQIFEPKGPNMDKDDDEEEKMEESVVPGMSMPGESKPMKQKPMPASIEKASKEPKPAANKDVKPDSDGNEMKSKDQAIVPKVSVPNVPKADEPKNMKADEKSNSIPMPDPVKRGEMEESAPGISKPMDSKQKSMPVSVEEASKQPKPATNEDVPKVSVPNVPKADESKKMKANPIPMPDPVKKADEKPKTEQMTDKKADMSVRSDGKEQIKQAAVAKPIDPNASKEKKQKNPGKDDKDGAAKKEIGKDKTNPSKNADAVKLT